MTHHSEAFLLLTISSLLSDVNYEAFALHEIGDGNQGYTLRVQIITMEALAKVRDRAALVKAR